jgi:hypothetical protein
MDWLQGQSFDLLDWPAQSPDLNIIENVWNIMVQRLEMYTCTNEDELRAAIINIWDSIDYDLIKKLYDSIPHRLCRVIESNGLPTKY